MKTFSIAELEQLTLIKAHTFRTWEYRFSIFHSKRTASNIRFYDLEELAFLLDLSLLNRLGSSISSLAGLTRVTIAERVQYLKGATAEQEKFINRLIISLFSMNVADFEQALNRAETLWGMDTTIQEVIVPFIERLKLFTYKGHSASEYHFAITLLRKKIIHAIEEARPKTMLEKLGLLFLPKGEHYDLLLLYVQYRLKMAGLQILYLGTDVSAENLDIVMQRKQPHFLITFASAVEENKIGELSSLLMKREVENCFVTITNTEGLMYSPKGKIKFVSYKEVDKEILAYV